MSELGTYSVGGSFSSVTLSSEFSTVDNLLTGLPDNDSGAIKARNIRDSIYTLWKKVDSLSVTVSESGTVSSLYDRVSPTTVSVGGLPIGSTFSGTIQDALDRIFYPYLPPSGTLNSWSQKEYGDPDGYSFNLTWIVVKNSNPITSIVVNDVSKPLSPLSGTQPATSTHSFSLPTSSPGTQQSYTMTISDGTTPVVKTSTVTWKNKIYWGKIDLSSLGNPNLTTSTYSVTSISNYINSSRILNLTGAGANGLAYGNELSTTKNKTYSNINGSGNYLIFAWPSNVSGAYSPVFTVNGLLNSSFTRVKTNWSFTNQFGFSGSDYEVWISNTIQNSPLTIVVS